MKLKPAIHALWIGGFIFLNVFLWQEVLKGNVLTVSFFDVGQGDASFIETGQGKQILVDGGPDATVLEKLGKAMPFWDRSIDLVILSHPAQDHMAGLLDVLRVYKVQNILWTGIEKDTAVFKQWKEALGKEEEEGATVFFADAGQRIGPIEILYPFESLEGQKFEDDNDTSIVAELQASRLKVLFTGDATSKTEKLLLHANIDIDADILKVGHHGSKTSSSEKFIEAVSPDIAVISAGRNNRFGHPHKETLETLTRYGITVLRTDEQGDITFTFVQ